MGSGSSQPGAGAGFGRGAGGMGGSLGLDVSGQAQNGSIQSGNPFAPDQPARPAAESSDRNRSVPEPQSASLANDLPQESVMTDGVTVSNATASNPRIGKYWALQGLRGLRIRIDQSGDALAFRSLGTDPVLDVTVYHQSRMDWLAFAIAMAVLVCGLLLSRSRLRTRVWFVATIIVLACGLPLLGGPATEFAVVCEHALLAALLLIPIWVLIAVIGGLYRWISRHVTLGSAAAASILALAAASGTLITPQVQAQDLKELLTPLLEETRPVVVPSDAVVIPYDPSDVAGRNRMEKVLVPYQRYVELWNQAHPDQKIGPAAGQRKYSFAGARYEGTLGDDDQIVLKGTVSIELFVDGEVDVALALQEGVITSALFDGQPARLKANITSTTSKPPAQPAIPVPDSKRREDGNRSILTLLAEGKGRHQLELSVRLPVTRQGGWRTAHGVIPSAAATNVQLVVPASGTTVRRPLGESILSETTETGNQSVVMTLQPGGQLDVSWRGKISPGSVDQALTADSAALIDVREDGIGVAWRIDLSFGQTERGTFRLQVPSNYLVEKVEGKNVRGWDTQTQDANTQLNVELLKAVKQHEQLVVHLSRRQGLASSGAYELTVPVLSLPDAALHRGVLQIRRSPILELKTTSTTGVARTDGSQVTQQLQPYLDALQSPLGIRDYQAYAFNTTPFQVTLSVAQIAPRMSAQLRTIVRIGETESALESEIELSSQQRATYSVEIVIPTDLKLEQVTAPGLSNWALVTQDDRHVLRTFFSAGQAGSFPISIRGRLSDHAVDQAIDLPRLEVLGASEQRGTIAIQVDPSLDARATELQHCQSVLLDRVVPWLNDEQRPLARLALEYPSAQYAGKIEVSPRQSRVTCSTITNVRVTFREIQETILLDFHIAEAGIRALTFRIPSRLNNALISAPRLRQETVIPVEGEDYVRVQLDLQDAITGDYRVVIENDRAITPGRQIAPLPLVDLGTVSNRYVTLENAGRDEIVVDTSPQMEPVNRPSRQWEQLAARLSGGDFASAYVTSDDSPQAEFGYRTKQRAMVTTAGATIGLARTDLVLDASGAYRASMLLKVDNRTEPYLEIRLPQNAALWTAHVASRPVKPARSVGSTDPSLLRIPLIKTAEGDLDYPVVLKYAGKFDSLDALTPIEFPVIRTENIHIELSQVKLYLPKDYRWLQFDGTATRVAGEEDFAAGYVAYQTQQVEKLTQIIRASNEFSKSRAIYNVEKLGEQLRQMNSRRAAATSNERLRENLDSNARVLEAANQEIEELENQNVQTTDNRERLNAFYGQQQNALARNSVTRLGGNFAAGKPTSENGPAQVDTGTLFDRAWFGPSGQSASPADSRKPQGGLPGKDAAPAKKRLQDEQSFRVQQQMKMPAEGDAAKQVFEGPRPQTERQPPDQSGSRGRNRALGTKSELNRAYMDKIQQQAAMSQQGQNGVASVLPTPQQDGEQLEGAQAAGQATVQAPPQQGLAGLASLEFELPHRGQTFYFTTPRGNVTISARPLRRELSQRLVNFLWLVGILAALVVIVAVVRRISGSRAGRIASVVLLCGVGLLMIILLTFPLFGVAMFFGGILLAVSHRQQEREAPPT